ncbi:uncharacterized protein [Alexandromys fortis]|uniref:uncharacterized protein isoform X2 n=1 Tax=Alexandromys fortis TaxID=100897 RepID=UPI0021527C20|nr:uncharacterized protein LOC126500307 isoform X2 [Microtus fortis]
MGASRPASAPLPTHPPARPPRSSLGEGERTCEVGPRFFRLLSSGDCDPPARTAGVLLHPLSQEDVVGLEAASGGITGEAVKEKHAMGGHDA